MAEELVVSLTTVRSHIKSVLRKLGVRSQLAAVAAANSRDLRDDPPGTSA
jgi:DNA-binding NarL/FixJ family response regulator